MSDLPNSQLVNIDNGALSPVGRSNYNVMSVVTGTPKGKKNSAERSTDHSPLSSLPLKKRQKDSTPVHSPTTISQMEDWGASQPPTFAETVKTPPRIVIYQNDNRVLTKLKEITSQEHSDITNELSMEQTTPLVLLNVDNSTKKSGLRRPSGSRSSSCKGSKSRVREVNHE